MRPGGRGSALPWIVGFAVAAATLILSPQTGRRPGPLPAAASDLPSHITAPVYLPEKTPAAKVEMDHGEKFHHSHQHLADHKGAGHNPAGIGEHHHHHHTHPHAADPKHHHPIQ